ncbi:hypothetical protein GN956_G9746 [Arapaima gigas]
MSPTSTDHKRLKTKGMRSSETEIQGNIGLTAAPQYDFLRRRRRREEIDGVASSLPETLEINCKESPVGPG